MANLDTIRFQKISLVQFSAADKAALVKELKRRNITHRLTASAVLFDERFLRQVKDLVPPSSR
jgi:hypothetical protein